MPVHNKKPQQDRMPPIVRRLMAMRQQEFSDLIYGWSHPDDCLEHSANEVIRRARRGLLSADDLLAIIDLEPEPGHPLNRAVLLQITRFPGHAEKVCELADDDGIWHLEVEEFDCEKCHAFSAEITEGERRFFGKGVAERKLSARRFAVASAVLASINAVPPTEWVNYRPPQPRIAVNLEAATRNPKGYLAGFCQKHELGSPVFDTSLVSKAHKPSFATVGTILWNDRPVSARGHGRTKAAAEVQSALAILKILAGMDTSPKGAKPGRR